VARAIARRARRCCARSSPSSGRSRVEGHRLVAVPTRLASTRTLRCSRASCATSSPTRVRYTRSGAVVIGARRRGDHVVVEVVDTGTGIAGTAHASSDSSACAVRARRAQRTRHGLGLAIVRRLARLPRTRGDARNAARLRLALRRDGTPRTGVRTPLRRSRHAACATGGALRPVRRSRWSTTTSRPSTRCGRCSPRGAATVAGGRTRKMRWRSSPRSRAVPDLIRRRPVSRARRQWSRCVKPRMRHEIGARVPALVVSGDTVFGRAGRACGRGLALLPKPVRARCAGRRGGRMIARAASAPDAVPHRERHVTYPGPAPHHPGPQEPTFAASGRCR